jgi:hypothetical protein
MALQHQSPAIRRKSLLQAAISSYPLVELATCIIWSTFRLFGPDLAAVRAACSLLVPDLVTDARAHHPR